MPAPDQADDLLDVEGPLGDEDHVGAAGEPGVERDPAGVAAHHLDDHHPVVALGRGVEPVDGLGGDLHGGVEPEGHVGAAEVVVDRLRHADHRQAVVAVQPGRGAQRVLAADRDQPVEVERCACSPRIRSGPPSCVKRVGPRGAQDRAAAREDAAGRLDRQLLVGVLERAAPAVAEADDRVPVRVDALAHDRPDDRVEAGAVAASGEHSDAHERRRYPRPSQSAAWLEPTTAALVLRWRSSWAAASAARSARRRIEGDTVTIYSSLPRHGVSARRRARRAAGQRLALEDAGGRAGDLEVKLVELDSAEPGERLWDPDVVSRTPRRRPTTRARSPTSASSTTARRRSPCRSRTTRACSRCRRATASRASPAPRPAARAPGPSATTRRTSATSCGWCRPTSCWPRRCSAGSGTRRRSVAVLYDGEIHSPRAAAGSCRRSARRDGPEPVETQEYRGRVDEIPDVVRDIAEDRPEALRLRRHRGTRHGPHPRPGRPCPARRAGVRDLRHTGARPGGADSGGARDGRGARADPARERAARRGPAPARPPA